VILSLAQDTLEALLDILTSLPETTPWLRMRTILKFVSILLALRGAEASTLTVGSGPIALSLEKLEIKQPHTQDIIKRDWPRDGLTDNSNLFLAQIGIGSPPQRISIAVDTGSPATWVNPDCSSAGIAYSSQCEALGHYNPSSSTPPGVRFTALDRTAHYADGSSSVLQGYKDVWTWANNTKVVDTPFSVSVKSSSSYVGIMGLGPDVKDGFDTGFSNYSLLNTMVSQGLIPSRAFSMGFTPGYKAKTSTAGELILRYTKFYSRS